MLINPYYPPASDEGLYRWFETVCAGVDIGVWLFDTAYSGVSLPLDLIERLAAIENVCGIKVGRDHARYLEVLARVGGQILVCEPNEGTWLENMRDHGQRVFMSSAAPYLYQIPDWQPMRDYTRLALAGDFGAAAQVAATLDPVRVAAAKWLHGKARRFDSIASIKAWAGLLGMSGGPVRPPLLPHTEAETAELAADLEAVGLLPGSGPARPRPQQRAPPGHGLPAVPARPVAARWPRHHLRRVVAEVMSSTRAALRPGAPVMEPPGWVVPPVWYSPGMGIRCPAQPGTGRSAPLNAGPRFPPWNAPWIMCGFSASMSAGDLTRLARITSSVKPGAARRSRASCRCGVRVLDGVPAAHLRGRLVHLRAEDLHGVLPGRRPPRVGQRGGGHQHPGRLGDEPARPQVRAQLDHVLRPARQAGRHRACAARPRRRTPAARWCSSRWRSRARPRRRCPPRSGTPRARPRPAPCRAGA